LKESKIMGMTHLSAGTIKNRWQLLPVGRNQTDKKQQHLPKAGRQALTVSSLLDSIRPIPDRSILLGRCTDGLPFLMEFGDPNLGAILIGSEMGHGKTHQLQVMVDSAIRTLPAYKLQVAILTLNTEEWTRFSDPSEDRKYLQGMYAWYDPAAEGLIAALTELAESRRDGQRTGADVLLILDDLTAVKDLSCEAQVNLRWLLEYGAQSGIWVIATVGAKQAVSMRYWIDTFRTRIVGKVEMEEQTAILSDRSDVITADLSPAQFKVWTGESWLKYSLPLLGDLKALEV
jgi:hypothetical protein